MLKPSWIKLEKEAQENHLDQDLVLQDLFHGQDIGWLSQMTTLIRDYAKPGDRILDPFSGLGTTLIAAGLLGFEAKGIEIDASRVSLSKARLDKIPSEKLDRSKVNVQQGDARSLPLPDQSIDLVLTSVPYFGADRSPDHGWTRTTGQLYFSEIYEEYLGHIETVLKELNRVLAPNGRCILVAENIRNRDGHFFPMAWDLARLMGFHFQMKDERIIVYPHTDGDSFNESPTSNVTNSIDGQITFATNRRHEYALVGTKDQFSN